MYQAGPGSPGSHRRYSPYYVRRQHAALTALAALARPEGDAHAPYVRPRHGHDHDRVRKRDSTLRPLRPVSLAPREEAPGCLSESYDIPTVRFHHKRARGIFLSTLLVGAVIAARVVTEVRHAVYVPLLAVAAPIFAFRAGSWLLSWKDEPVRVGRRAQEYLNRLCVVVTVPVYNEDPALLDRCLYSLVNQTRPPQRVEVVDDGSKLDYSELKAHWARWWPGGTEVRWLRQPNQGKRRAHANTFAAAYDADVFVTVDSDTTLEHRALEEGLKPFIDSRVMSVAGMEFGFNAFHNFLTRMQHPIQLYSQCVTGATWSACGDMFTNRGPFALYRATMIREIIDVYRNEVFFGRRVILGDDSLLALCGSSRGKSVQQLSAVGLTMWPEQLGHHLRQRLRWARGRAVRNFWRLKYRPLFSYVWWYTAIGIYTWLLSLSWFYAVVDTWPDSAHIIAHVVLVMFLWTSMNQFRAFCFSRSDETWSDRLLMLLMRPLTSLWAGVVLNRFVRALGTLTVLRQGWTTRQQGAEIVFTPAESEVAA